MRTPPYNTDKVKIGMYYEPKRYHYPTPEEEFWQALLLGDRPRKSNALFYLGLVLMAAPIVAALILN